MRQLSGLDASFLHLETPEMPMHVGALHWLELPAGYKGDYLADLRAHLAGRLAFSPALRRKLVTLPMNFSNPGWVETPVDIDAHVVEVRLPRGAGIAEVEAEVGRLHPVLLPRDRPLWKFHLFTNLPAGPGRTRRFALYTQLHHAAVDGQAAVALAKAILDLTPVPATLPTAPARQPRGRMGMAGLLRSVLGQQLAQVGSAVKALPAAIGTLSALAVQTARAPGALGNVGIAPRTRLNASVTATRAFAGVSLPIDELNAVRRRHGASLNDAVLFVCGGALRRLFLAHGPLPRKSLVAAVPVSTRAAGDATANNQASMTVVSLGTHIADPSRRLAHLMAATAAMKSSLGAVKSLMPTDFPTLGVPWLMQGLSALYGKVRAAEKLPALANVVISNVPGPQVPLYLAGARMITNYPTSIVVHGLALNITVQTYDQSLDVGLMACGRALPEVAELGEHLREAMAEFAALPVAGREAGRQGGHEAAAPAVAKATRRTRASAPTAARGRR